MTFSDVFLPVPFLASPFDLHRLAQRALVKDRQTTKQNAVQPGDLWTSGDISLRKRDVHEHNAPERQDNPMT